MSETQTASIQRTVYAPIRSLGPGHRERIAAHLLALEPADRYLRFGYSAGDVQIQHYADHLNFDRDDVFGIYNRRLELLAMAHLAYASSPECDSCAEFGVSVSQHARGRGYGKRLFERAVMHARNQGVHMLFIHALTENTPMLAIAARRCTARARRIGNRGLSPSATRQLRQCADRTRRRTVRANQLQAQSPGAGLVTCCQPCRTSARRSPRTRPKLTLTRSINGCHDHGVC